MKRTVTAVVALTVLLAVSTGCSILKSWDANKAGNIRATISLWHNFTGDDLRAQTMRAIIQEFEEAHPKIKVQVREIAPDEYRKRLKESAETGHMPDVFVLWSGAMTREYAAASLIQPIDELVDAYPEWRDGFLPNSLEAFKDRGLVYGAPMGLSPTSILYYNKRIFEENRLSVPKTWSELLYVIDKLNRNGITPVALGNKAGWPAQSSIFSSLADRVTGTEWLMYAVRQEGGVRFTDPTFIEALNYMKQLGEAGAFQAGYQLIDNVEMELMFARGEAAMMIDGGWALTNLAANATQEAMNEMGAALLPAIPGGKGDPNTLAGAVGSGMALGKSATGAKKDAAFELIYAMSGPEAQQRTLESNQLVSYKIELDKSKVSPIFAEVYDLVNSVSLTPVYDGVLTTEGAEALNDGLQELLEGGDPKQIAASIQEAHAKALGQLLGSMP
ncbi:extracellular solute-binding protein [Paenibacillus sp. 1011MAR3C5]|uniref:extracellular solute-binding protein n=1 Tax=Paenibacillus sp. 1011MAR3C5 TaxID=1675787 RepID=UPI000E6D2B52|nr:extracellular solute-binding protein [Paenibacillus sp. 1011MAR3C5]RJE87696.1 extracellular solute-binding protein [Paenibacillus sp. 1011MAR3C5]